MGLLEPISEIMGKLDAPGAGHTGRPFSAAFLTYPTRAIYIQFPRNPRWF